MTEAVNVHLVDVGKELIKHQRALLGCISKGIRQAQPSIETQQQQQQQPLPSQHFQRQQRAGAVVDPKGDSVSSTQDDALSLDELLLVARPSNDDTQAEHQELFAIPTINNIEIPVTWHSSIVQVPNDCMANIITTIIIIVVDSMPSAS
jgi:hypothetical protein